MMLLFDLGNSRCKWQLRTDTGEPAAGGALPYTENGKLPPALFERLAALDESPSSARVCTVAAPELLRPLDQWLQDRFGCVLQRFITRMEDATGVTNAYPEPSSLGADRWAALIGARVHYTGRLCIVDCGTAVTLDVLEADGSHAGGLIFPGLRLSRRALATAAHRLGESGEGDLPLLAKDTPTAIRAGTYHALAGALASLKARVDSHGDHPCQGILTGGDADALADTLGGAWVVDHDLIFRGIASGTVAP